MPKNKRNIEKFQNKKELFRYIIKKVSTSKDTSAYFTTIICFTVKLGQYLIFEGKVLGHISKIPRGKNGFGFKLVLIYAKWGEIETVDHIRKKKYFQRL